MDYYTCYHPYGKASGIFGGCGDIEIGFNIENPLETRRTILKYLLKKPKVNNSYVRLVRGEYHAFKDGTTFYIRIYNLESNQCMMSR